MNENHAQRVPDTPAMSRMFGLLDTFAKSRITRRSLEISANEEPLHIEEHPAIACFVDLAYTDGWMLTGFDWSGWDEGREIVDDPAKIEKADLLTIQKLITALVRNERFCDGALQSAYEGGVIECILRRIGQLYAECVEGGSHGCI